VLWPILGTLIPGSTSFKEASVSNPDDSVPVRPVPTAGLDLNELDGAFRETYLYEVSNPEAHAAIRAFGKFLMDITLESRQHSPFDRGIDFTAYSLQAGLVDLRYLQHSFVFWSEEGNLDPKVGEDERKRHRELFRLSARIAKRIGKLADDLEKEVGDWKFEIKA
jgi:hypothetical protein